MPQRDYLLRLIEEAAQVIAQIAHLREEGQPSQAVSAVIDGLEKLFGLTVTELGSLDTDQLFGQLTREESPENARDKCIIFAALNNQAGLAYAERDLPALSQPAFHLALVFTLRALTGFSRSNLPPITPNVDHLLYQLEGFELPASTLELLAAYRLETGSAKPAA
jgi:hypothetical protein